MATGGSQGIQHQAIAYLAIHLALDDFRDIVKDVDVQRLVAIPRWRQCLIRNFGVMPQFPYIGHGVGRHYPSPV